MGVSILKQFRNDENRVFKLEMISSSAFNEDIYKEMTDWVNSELFDRYSSLEIVTTINGVTFEVKRGDTPEQLKSRHVKKRELIESVDKALSLRVGEPKAVVVLEAKETHFVADPKPFTLTNEGVLSNEEIYRLIDSKYFVPIPFSETIDMLVDEEGIHTKETYVDVITPRDTIRLYGKVLFVNRTNDGDYTPLTQNQEHKLIDIVRAKDFGKNVYKKQSC
ncbi:hypothetical protein P4493_04655 [Bacillus thuringiensis]|uniref:Uncharacterized protein n=3 Tax=Bacillus thuringiensis TaxID=1428 RepID=A0A0B5NNX5_BACTU|nr:MULTISPECIES: hypothetical protein [Bacillus]EAO56890.1 hypothetical protein RBTH_07620 [Bacillus thuringiensis serovar israelensis ATCC 35646]MEC2535168.1 hypothetical protein [Bacillus cereus]MED1153717.1 hypothetical protein [Bacillus paranthracis]OUB09410.1 hypothetical protein BK708_33355 [Bacillus thuringiensis serovar yunnanensis]AFQ30037.1 hypothetical protein BTF1_29682 [Bacillus thuringiensis HD-789]